MKKIFRWLLLDSILIKIESSGKTKKPGPVLAGLCYLLARSKNLTIQAFTYIPGTTYWPGKCSCMLSKHKIDLISVEMISLWGQLKKKKRQNANWNGYLITNQRSSNLSVELRRLTSRQFNFTSLLSLHQ